MSKELRNQSNLDDEEMKWAKEQFRKLEKFDFVEDTIEIEGAPDKTKELQKKYREQGSIYKKWMLYKAKEVLEKDISVAYTEIRKYFGITKQEIEEGKNHFDRTKQEIKEEKKFIMELHDPDGDIKDGKILGGSQLLQYIYKKLWSELTAQEFMKHLLDDDQNTWICSDTMTSAQQRMNDFLQVIKDDDFEDVREEIKKEIKKEIRYSLRLCMELYLRGESEKYYGTTFQEKICNKAGEEAEKQLSRFLGCWHMLGNYCPVPRHFNSARSGQYAVHDYWDLTLLKIQEYYKKRDKEDEVWKILGEELLHGKGNALACKLWLDYFGSWENFIEKNYMQDFVDADIEDGYKVKLFFEGHSWNKPKPEKLDEFKELFEKSSKMIEKRTERIVNALIEEYKQEQLLDDGIMAKLKTIGTK